MSMICKEMNRKRRKRLCSMTLAAVLGFTGIFAGNTDWISRYKVAAASEDTTKVTEEEGQVSANSYGLRTNIQDGTILHCFDWKYNDIKEELPNIAAAGFTSVQTSPAQKGDGQIWYWLYQPQTFSIQQNALGSKAELQALCEEAEKYGIQVVVDVVANHTRAIGDDGLGSDCYHNDGDAWYSDRYGITHGKIGMPDLNSESSTVQNKVKGYIEELKSVGVDGIRWDAAKHISLPSEGCQFWPVVTSVGLWNYGEILVGPTEGGTSDPTGKALMKEYTDYMSVTDSKYGQEVREAFVNGGVPSTIGNWSENGVAKNKLVYWSESHDTYSNDGEYGEATQWNDQNAIDRAYAIVAGQGQASALYFSRPYQTSKQSIMAGDKGSTHFTSKEVAAVNHLHNNCVGEKDYYVNGGNAAAVCRESGAVIVKGSGSGQVTIANGGGTTAPGTYVDEVSGNTWTVTADTISGSVNESGIAVIYKDNGSGDDPTPIRTNTPIQTNAPSDAPVVSVSANMIVATKPSGWSDMYIYAYQPGASVTELTGAWPGTKMTVGTDGKYTYTMGASVTSAKIIFASGASGSQDPQDVDGQDCGFDYAGGKAYSYDGGQWSEIPISIVTNDPVINTPSPTATAKPTIAPTATPKVTETPKPTVTPTAKPTETPVEGPQVSVSLENGSVFRTETQDVKLTFKNATEVKYSVDGGPRKTVDATKNQNVTVTLGQGKIGNSEVVLEVESTDGSRTNKQKFTYTKEFVKTAGTVKTLSTFANSVMDKITEEARTVNGAAETGGMYATNPNGGVGKEATITIDGSFSDWSEDMLIAQGGAWDIANNWKGGHENCVLDDYALYAAWDNDNLYIGWQMVNTTDTWANPGDGPLSDGGRVLDVPLMLAINVGNRPAMTGKMATGGLIWDALDVSFETRIDNLLLMSGKVGLGTPGYFIASDAAGGASYDPEYCLSFATEGISYKMAEGCLPSSIMMLDNSQSPDDAYDISKYVDAMSKGHDTTYDSFYEINIPLKTLGIDKTYLEENGIGIMQIATRGTSGIDCIPHDPSMLDNVTGDCAVDPSTSHEKDDSDIITVPLAAVGNIKAGGDGGNIIIPTSNPPSTETPTTKTPSTETPSTETPSTKTPSTETPITEQIYCVNFGADRSSPQYDTTSLVLKAEAFDGVAPYSYEFSIDGKVVQAASTKDTYTWKGTAGEHTIKVVVKDKNGNETSSEKKYVIEEENANVPTSVPTETPKATETVAPTKTPEVTVAPTDGSFVPSITETVPATEQPTPTEKPIASETEQPSVTGTPDPSGNNYEDLAVTLTTNKKSSQVKGTKIKLTANATGGSGNYTYSFMTELSTTNAVTSLAQDSNSSSVTWAASKKGTYRLIAIVTDTETGLSENATITFKITAAATLKCNTFKAGKSTVVKNKKVVLKASATGGTGTVKYKFYYKKKGTKKLVVIRKYKKTKKVTWKVPSKTGTYYVYCKVKDGSGKTLTKRITIKVKKK